MTQRHACTAASAISQLAHSSTKLLCHVYYRLLERQKSKHRLSCVSGQQPVSQWLSSVHSKYVANLPVALLYTLRETMLITCCMDAAYTEEDCSSVQDAGPNPADLQQGHRAEAGLVLQMCRHRPHCPFAHGCFKGTACFKKQLQLYYVLLAEADIQLAIIIRQAVDTDQLAK